MKSTLTDRELEVFVYMKDFFRKEDALPPLRLIAETFGYASSSGALNPCRTLEMKGYIEKNAVGKYRFARQGAGA